MPTQGSRDISTFGTGERMDERRIDYVAIATILLREKKSVAKVALIIVFLALCVAFLLKPTYTGEALFLPPQSAPGTGITQLIGQVSSLGSMGGALGGLKSPGDIYVGLLGSTSIADQLINQFDLQHVYKKKYLIDTRKALKNHSKFTLGKDSLIVIKVDDHDRKRAADLANGYLAALRNANSRLALTDASQRRMFFGDQLEREKNALADAEVELKKTQEKTGLIAPNGQAQVEIEEMAQIRAQITSRQVQMASLRQGATDQNPQIILLQSEISGLQQQLQKLAGRSQDINPGALQVPTARVPELALQYIRSQREVKYHEVLFDLMAKQYETARLDEARESPLLQVVDYATVPDKKSGPPRVLIIIVGAFLGICFGISWVLVKDALTKVNEDPEAAAKWMNLRVALFRR